MGRKVRGSGLSHGMNSPCFAATATYSTIPRVSGTRQPEISNRAVRALKSIEEFLEWRGGEAGGPMQGR